MNNAVYVSCATNQGEVTIFQKKLNYYVNFLTFWGLIFIQP